MNSKKLLFVSLFLIITGVILNDPFATKVSYGPGIIAPENPVQQPTDTKPFIYKDFSVIPQALFSIEAKVLAKEHYSFDTGSKVSPVDLVLGWGTMSDEAVLKTIDIKQRNRFYFWHVDQFPIPRRDIEQQSANMHLIPASSNIAGKIDRVNEGQLIRFSGYLVNIERDDGWHWNSSLSRSDTGGGACELVWVEEFEIVHKSEVILQ